MVNIYNNINNTHSKPTEYNKRQTEQCWGSNRLMGFPFPAWYLDLQL